MVVQRFIWKEPDRVPEDVRENLASYTPAFQSLLYQRGYDTLQGVADFISASEKTWFGTQKLRHLDRAAQIISSHIAESHPIVVYGDYDADGITSTALLTLALRKIHSKVLTMIPSRLDDGYGLNLDAINQLHYEGAKLILTVDNGIRSFSEVQHANSLGLQVIITDHHTPEEDLPPAAAVINPKLPDDPYPFKELAGVGVAYKLAWALSEIYPAIRPKEYLDLVAIGTVADIVPLVSENRYLVKEGLTVLNRHQRQGLVSLAGAAGLTQRNITAADISFQIAPRLNASGRLASESAETPLALLLSSDRAACGTLAQELENHNTKRKILSRSLEDRLEASFAGRDPGQLILFAFDEEINLGVAGIAAGFLTRQHYLPAVIGQIDRGLVTASCRSIPEFNLIHALDACRNLFVRYGGHSLAAGFTIAEENLPAMVDFLDSRAREQLSHLDLNPVINIDAEILLSQVSLDLYSELDQLEPCGSKNPRAVFLSKNLAALRSSRVGISGSHLKMTISDGQTALDVIGFNLGDLDGQLDEQFDMVYYLTVNEYRGKREFQLQALDFRLSASINKPVF